MWWWWWGGRFGGVAGHSGGIRGFEQSVSGVLRAREAPLSEVVVAPPFVMISFHVVWDFLSVS